MWEGGYFTIQNLHNLCLHHLELVQGCVLRREMQPLLRISV